MKTLSVVGARPQFVKAAVVSRALEKQESITDVLVHTGQHFDSGMSDIFFEELEIKQPSYNLQINDLSHGAMTGRMLERIEEVLLSEQPDCVVVYGDTNSTLAGALAANKLHIDVAHVEAGLRSFDFAMPEEVNRVLTDRLSRVLYCPTDAAVENLRREGFEHFDCRVVKCGDVMEDAARFYSNKASSHSQIIDDLGLDGIRFVLCTMHRAENTDDPKRLAKLVEGLNTLGKDLNVVIPLHPRTRAALSKFGLNLQATIIEPVGYLDMIALIDRASLVLTDSGGLQKEAYFFDTYCITLRDETEWVELVDHGFNVLVGCESDKLIKEVERLVGKPFERTIELYGGGRAADEIVKDLLENY